MVISSDKPSNAPPGQSRKELYPIFHLKKTIRALRSVKSQGFPRNRTLGSHRLYTGTQKEQPFLPGHSFEQVSGGRGPGSSQGPTQQLTLCEKRRDPSRARGGPGPALRPLPVRPPAQRPGPGPPGHGTGEAARGWDGGGHGGRAPGLSPRASAAVLPSTSPAMAAPQELHHGRAEPTRRRLASASPALPPLPFRARAGQTRRASSPPGADTSARAGVTAGVMARKCTIAYLFALHF